MRKVFAFAAVASLLTFAACGEKKHDESAMSDSTATMTSVDTASSTETMMDSAAAAPAADSSAMSADTAHKM